MEYYKIPLKFSRFFEEKDSQLNKCSEKESIDQYLELLLTTIQGEHRFDKEFGSPIYEIEFERIKSNIKWEEEFKTCIYNTVTRNETRLSLVEVKMKVKEHIQKDNLMQTLTIRKRIDISILGILKSSGERCGFGYSIYLGPLSIE